MKRSSRRRWTKAEKWLFGAPVLVMIFAAAMNFGPELVRKKMGWPRRVEVISNGFVYSLKLSKNGQTLAVAALDKQSATKASRIELWDARTLQKRDGPPNSFVGPAVPVSLG